MYIPVKSAALGIKNNSKRSRLTLTSIITFTLLFAGASQGPIGLQQAFSHTDPVTCFNNSPGLGIAAFRDTAPPGPDAGDLTPVATSISGGGLFGLADIGEQVIFRVTLKKSSAADDCNFETGTVKIRLPDNTVTTLSASLGLISGTTTEGPNTFTARVAYVVVEAHDTNTCAASAVSNADDSTLFACAFYGAHTDLTGGDAGTNGITHIGSSNAPASNFTSVPLGINPCLQTSCNDNNACTSDTCDGSTGQAVCSNTPLVCNDQNACTTDACDPATGCTTTPLVCNDQNACTADSCDPATGCLNTVIQGCGATRTQGYWSTHLAQADDTYADLIAGNDELQCADGFDVDSTAKLMGGFHSGISKETDKDPRSSVDQARMRLAGQLLAAMLNDQAFGTSPDSFGTSIAAGITAFCGQNVGAMNTAQSNLGAFNNSGDNFAFPAGFVNSPATPTVAKTLADKQYWDQPSLAGPPP